MRPKYIILGSLLITVLTAIMVTYLLLAISNNSNTKKIGKIIELSIDKTLENLQKEK